MDYDKLNKIKKYKAIVKERGSNKERIVYGYLSIASINCVYDEEGYCKQKIISYVFLTDEIYENKLVYADYPNYIYSPKTYEEDEFEIIDDEK